MPKERCAAFSRCSHESVPLGNLGCPVANELPRTPYLRSSQTSHLGRVGEASAGAVVATDRVSVDADWDNGAALQFQACHGLSKPRQKVFPRTRVNMGQRETDPAIWFLTS